MNKIYLGKFKGENLWITKHSWDCDWYWGFGYIGNNNLHTHFDSNFLQDGIADASKFEKLNFQAKTWWLILDLFKQAYSLKEAAATYKYGGHIASNDLTLIIRNEEMESWINTDCEKVLDKAWEVMEEYNLGLVI